MTENSEIIEVINIMTNIGYNYFRGISSTTDSKLIIGFNFSKMFDLSNSIRIEVYVNPGEKLYCLFSIEDKSPIPLLYLEFIEKLKQLK